jgi:hypothetical protein
MGHLITEPGAHREWLRELLASTDVPVRIASPFVTETDLFLDAGNRDVRLLTALSTLAVAFGSTSLDALEMLIGMGVECRVLPDDSRFHAKVYLFGDECALVTSANLTTRALDLNIEVGVQLSGSEVRKLHRWFQGLWESARRVELTEIQELRRTTTELYRKCKELRNQCRPKKGASTSRVVDLFDSSTGFFLCNTDRKHGHDPEEAMKTRCYAAAWEDFDHTNHMKLVKNNDIIFMYANKVGIVGIGRALGPCERLEPGNPDMVCDDVDSAEWRVPVEWLEWVDDEHACPWHGVLPPTSQDLSTLKKNNHRVAVLKHFFGPLPKGI